MMSLLSVQQNPLFNLYIGVLFQDGSAQAQSNLKFLSTLTELCERLSKAKPADIPEILTPLLNKVRMIWVNSEHFKSRERLTGLFRKVMHSS